MFKAVEDQSQNLNILAGNLSVEHEQSWTTCHPEVARYTGYQSACSCMRA